MSNLVFNGHDFATLFAFGDPEIKILDSQPVLEQVSGRNGEAFIGMTYGSSEVTFSIGVSDTAANRRAAFSTLGSWLDVDGPKHLSLPDTTDRYYLAVPKGPIDLERCVSADVAKVTFRLVDPIAYGATKTATVPASGGSVEVTIGGTAPTTPTIAASAAVRDASALIWGISLDSTTFVHVATGSGSSRAVEVDCTNRTCTVANAVALPTLDSDWLVLTPGTHTLTRDYGTGAATVTWVERWY